MLLLFWLLVFERSSSLRFGKGSDALFHSLPPRFDAAMEIVDKSLRATKLDLALVECDNGLGAFEFNGLLGSYAHVECPKLSYGTAYKTLSPENAFFGGVSLWPLGNCRAPNFTLYFGSGSPRNPKQIFMRLEMIPRVDSAADAQYCRDYYTYAGKMDITNKEDYVSTDPYARMQQTGLRIFFEDDEFPRAEEACVDLARFWGTLLDDESDVDLVERDKVIRRVAAENSPDNAYRAQAFGEKYFPLTKDFLSGDRT